MARALTVAAKGGRADIAMPMKGLKNGDFTTTVDLDPGQEYQFRYLIDEEVWENDTGADRYTPNPFGDGDNCVLKL